MAYFKTPNGSIIDLDAVDLFQWQQCRGYRESEFEDGGRDFYTRGPKVGAKGYPMWYLRFYAYAPETGKSQEVCSIEVYCKDVKQQISDYFDEKLKPFTPNWGQNKQPK